MVQQREEQTKILKKELDSDDITGKLAGEPEMLHNEIFDRELAKHDKRVGYIRQNLAAQEKILSVLDEARVNHAAVYRKIRENNQLYDEKMGHLIAAANHSDSIVNKLKSGEELLETLRKELKKVSGALEAAAGMRKSQIQKKLAPARPKMPKPEKLKPKIDAELEAELKALGLEDDQEFLQFLSQSDGTDLLSGNFESGGIPNVRPVPSSHFLPPSSKPPVEPHYHNLSQINNLINRSPRPANQQAHNNDRNCSSSLDIQPTKPPKTPSLPGIPRGKIAAALSQELSENLEPARQTVPPRVAYPEPRPLTNPEASSFSQSRSPSHHHTQYIHPQVPQSAVSPRMSAVEQYYANMAKYGQNHNSTMPTQFHHMQPTAQEIHIRPNFQEVKHEQPNIIPHIPNSAPNLEITQKEELPERKKSQTLIQEQLAQQQEMIKKSEEALKKQQEDFKNHQIAMQKQLQDQAARQQAELREAQEKQQRIWQQQQQQYQMQIQQQLGSITLMLFEIMNFIDFFFRLISEVLTRIIAAIQFPATSFRKIPNS